VEIIFSIELCYEDTMKVHFDGSMPKYKQPIIL